MVLLIKYFSVHFNGFSGDAAGGGGGGDTFSVNFNGIVGKTF